MTTSLNRLIESWRKTSISLGGDPKMVDSVITPIAAQISIDNISERLLTMASERVLAQLAVQAPDIDQTTLRRQVSRAIVEFLLSYESEQELASLSAKENPAPTATAAPPPKRVAPAAAPTPVARPAASTPPTPVKALPTVKPKPTQPVQPQTTPGVITAEPELENPWLIDPTPAPEPPPSRPQVVATPPSQPSVQPTPKLQMVTPTPPPAAPPSPSAPDPAPPTTKPAPAAPSEGWEPRLPPKAKTIESERVSRRSEKVAPLLKEIMDAAESQSASLVDRDKQIKGIMAEAKRQILEFGVADLDRKALEMLADKQWSQAATIAIHMALIQSSVDASRFCVSVGDALMQAGQANLASLCYTQAIIGTPPCEIACWRLGEAGVKLKNSPQAQQWLELIARLLYVAGRDIDAIAVYRQLLSINPGRRDVHELISESSLTNELPD